MRCSAGQVEYVKLLGQSTLHYAEAARCQYGVRLEHTSRFGVPLTPMLRYMDNVALVSVALLTSTVFARDSPVRRGTFIEDTYGKQLQMHEWLRSAREGERTAPDNG